MQILHSPCDVYSKLHSLLLIHNNTCQKYHTIIMMDLILGDSGADKGGEGKSKRAEKPFWLLIGARKTQFSGTNQKPERRRPFGTGLVRHCPQGLFSPFFTFLFHLYFSARLDFPSPPFICPWVSEDGWTSVFTEISRTHICT